MGRWSRKNRSKKKFQSRYTRTGRPKLSCETLEPRWVLSSAPVLNVVTDQTVDEGVEINLADIGIFEDVVEGAGTGGGASSIGLNPNDFTALPAFDPAANVVIDTNLMTIDGVAAGTTVSAEVVAGLEYEIAVFTFADFELDAGITLTATGSRPLAILSQDSIDIYGTIDVSATWSGSIYDGELIAGAGGGDGAPGSDALDRANGEAAAGAPYDSTGPASSAGSFVAPPIWGVVGGGTGAGHGGLGGQSLALDNTVQGFPGATYGDLTVGIQGGSGGATAGMGYTGPNGDPFLAGGGGGGGGIELGAINEIYVDASGQVLADGGDGQHGVLRFSAVVGGGGGGAGGGILLHADLVNNHGTLSAQGGNGGNGIDNSILNGDASGGGGGGGRVLVAYADAASEPGTALVNGGAGGNNRAVLAGADGVFGDIQMTPPQVPVIESYDFIIDWGDGSTPDAGAATIDTAGVNIGDIVLGSFDGTHTYADDGAYEVTVSVISDTGSDASETTDTQTFTITVNNVAPSLAVANPLVTVDEGQQAANSGSFSDVAADMADVLLTASVGTVTWDAGGSWSWTFDSTDGPDESQTVTITADDQDGGTSSVTFDLTVDNIAPTIAAGSALVTIDEGQTAGNSGTFADPGDDTVTLSASLGDVVDLGGGAWSWSYDGTDDLSAPVTITATDDDGASQSVEFDLVVNNIAPEVGAGDALVTVDEGQSAGNSGTFADVPADVVALSASIGTVTPGVGGTWSWSFDTADGPADSQSVTITATDDDGGESSVSFDLVVENIAPVITADETAVAIDEGQTATNTGSFFDVPADVVSLTASLGDVTDLGGGAWSWSYTGTDDRVETVTITATDDDGGATSVAFDLTVNNVAPEIGNVATNSDAIGGAAEGETVTLTADFTDAGVLDTHTAVIDWGDGTTSAGVVDQVAGTVTADHVYADGGIYDVTVTITDDDSGETTGSAASVIAGVGVHDGVLQAIGTNGNDVVEVFRSLFGSSYYVLFSIGDSLQGLRSFNSSTVDEIDIQLGGGSDLAFVSSLVQINAFIDAGAGDDLLAGGSGDDILLGGPGYDVLYGSGGRDLMIAGGDGDLIYGDGGEDLLISGTTSFDNNRQALDLIMSEWTSGRSFDDRVDNISGDETGATFDDRLNELVFLIADNENATVFDDEATDWLIGGSGKDLYFDGNDDVSLASWQDVVEELEADAPA